MSLRTVTTTRPSRNRTSATSPVEPELRPVPGIVSSVIEVVSGEEVAVSPPPPAAVVGAAEPCAELDPPLVVGTVVGLVLGVVDGAVVTTVELELDEVELDDELDDEDDDELDDELVELDVLVEFAFAPGPGSVVVVLNDATVVEVLKSFEAWVVVTFISVVVVVSAAGSVVVVSSESCPCREPDPTHRWES